MNALNYLDIPTKNVNVAPPALEKLADDVAEEWVQRYRAESQTEWENVRW